MFTRSSEGCVAQFEPTEAEVLHSVVVEVMALLTADFDRSDPVIGRMFPDMYRDDPVGSEELRRYTEEELRTGKLDNAVEFLKTLPRRGGHVTLTEEQSGVWLRTLTDTRLALGTRLNITEDTDIEAELDDAVLRDPTSPQVGNLSVYAYLTFLQESLVAALMG